MDVLITLLVVIIIGAIAGFVARAVVPGSDPMGTVGTIVLGVVGAFVGWLLFDALFGGGSDQMFEFSVTGVLGAIVGAIIALLVYRAVTGRRSTHV